MENWFTPTKAGHPPATSRVWVLAPHPDDEVFGPGGTLLYYRDQGARIDVTVVTDGAGYSRSHPDDSSRQRVLGQRQQESRDALSTLGMAAPEFWDYADRSLVNHVHEIAVRIQTRLELCQEEEEPIGVLLVPGVHEIHPDHAALARAAILALHRLCIISEAQTEEATGKPSSIPNLLMYEVGAPMMPNLMVDIGPHWLQKQKAMRCFASQSQQQDYARHIAGLNAYRAYYLGEEVLYAEALRWIKPHELVATFAGLDPQLSRLRFWSENILNVAEADAENLQNQLIWMQREMQATRQSHIDQLNQVQEQLKIQGERYDREVAQLHHQLERLLEDHARLQWERNHFETEKNSLTKDLLFQQERYSQDVQQLTQSLGRVEVERQSIHQKLIAQQIDFSESQLQLDLQIQEANYLKQQIDTLSQVIKEMQHTWSWKITRPLRWIRNWKHRWGD